VEEVNAGGLGAVLEGRTSFPAGEPPLKWPSLRAYEIVGVQSSGGKWQLPLQHTAVHGPAAQGSASTMRGAYACSDLFLSTKRGGDQGCGAKGWLARVSLATAARKRCVVGGKDTRGNGAHIDR